MAERSEDREEEVARLFMVLSIGPYEFIALNVSSYQTHDGRSHFPSCELSFTFLQKVL